MSNSNSRWIGLACSIFSGIAFGAQFPVAAHTLKSVSPMYFVGIRYLLAALVFVPLLALTEGKDAFRLEGKGWLVWLYGTLAFTGYNGLVFAGQRLAGPSGPILSSVMMGFMPLITALILLIWKGIRLSPLTLLFIVIGLTGVFLVATKGDVKTIAPGGAALWAVLLMLASVVCWAIYTIGASMFPSWSPLRYTALTCMLGTVSNIALTAAGTPMGWFVMPAWHDLTANIWHFLYMALIAGVAAVLSWNIACKKMSPVDASLVLNNIVPVVSALITALIGYSIGMPELYGIALTLIAMIANNVAGRYGKKSVTAADGKSGLAKQAGGIGKNT
ncbi:DMT family transporter [Paenibacillus thalictri]|uniref:DMT family transporter n=1 Tax=Paenibacillus thalictri TaxID=2527873 RepID=A0A4V2J4E1_9BACL|nr:DMT family transporter [Paenibacillus thalictri]TBL79432.1 DMT family transporter [Paenibacillus thalictri]